MNIPNKFFSRNFSRFISISGMILFILILYQCRPGTYISGKEDFNRLEDVKRFEYDYSIHEGIKYRLLGDYTRAVYFFKRCIDIFPFSDVASFELSNIYFLAGEEQEAVNFAEKALSIDPANIWYYYHLARIYQETNNSENAIGVYIRATETFNENYDLKFTLAALYTLNENFTEALALYEIIEHELGIDERVSLSRQHIYMKAGQFEKAHEEIIKLISEYPEEPRYYGILAELYASINMESEALDSYQKLFKLDPENGMAQLSVAEFFIKRKKLEDAIYYLQAAFRNQGIGFNEKIGVLTIVTRDTNLADFSENIEQLGLLLINEYPDQNDALVVMTDFFLNRGIYDKAQELLSELYSRVPSNIVFAEQLIGVMSYNENYSDVVTTGERFLKEFPESSVIMYFLGIAYHILDMNDPAIEIFERALMKNEVEDEMKAHIYSYLGDLYQKKDEGSTSDYYFEKSLEIDSSNLITLNNYAYYLALRNSRLEDALAFSSVTIEMEPDNSSFLDTYAWILFRLGRSEEALVYIEFAYEKNGSESYEIVKHYGQILLELGRYEDARVYFNKARELTDNHNEIDRFLIIVNDILVN